MGDFGDCLRVPGEPENPDTLEWARRTSQEVQAAHAYWVMRDHAEGQPAASVNADQLALLRKQAAHGEGLEPTRLTSGGRYFPRHPAAPADPAAEIQAALRQYDEAVAAGDFALPDAPARAPGTCEYCGGLVGRAGGTVCRYCRAEGTERLAADRQPEKIPGLSRLIAATAPPARRARRNSPDVRRIGWDPWLAITSLAKGLLVALIVVAAISALSAITELVMHP